MTESFENLNNILRDWAKEKAQKISCGVIQHVREEGGRKTKPFLLLENDSEKYSSSLSRQSRKTKPNLKLL